MVERRKDNKGKILKDGETQRKDGRYQYRYIDTFGKRRTIYGKTLKELREKEEQALKDTLNRTDYLAAKITVNELIERYLHLKSHLKPDTVISYNSYYTMVKKCEIGNMMVCNVKMSDARQCILQLYATGKAYSTVNALHIWIKSIFRMALQDDLIMKNPFDFKLSTVIKRDVRERKPLSKLEQSELLSFLRADDTLYNRHFNKVYILLYTGLRVSELCGLTVDCLDFNRRIIIVNKQLLRTNDGKYHVQSTKSTSGNRIIPMTRGVYACLLDEIQRNQDVRSKVSLDGVKGFVFFNNKNDTPLTRRNLEYTLSSIVKKHNEMYPYTPLPNFSPHVLRHTFCTNLIEAGVNVKDVQYLMGHASSTITLDVYSHVNAEQAAQSLLNAMDSQTIERDNLTPSLTPFLTPIASA